MPLLERPGSSTQVSSQNVQSRETNKLTEVNKYTANAQDYDKLVQVKDTFTTQTPFNPERYPEIYKMLMAYPQGHKMVVPYYHRQTSNIDIRSFIVDLSMDEDSIHGDLTKIHNLEMTLESSLEATQQDEDKTQQITGTAIMYPGLEPHEGDMFLMEVGNNKIVLFVVTKITPTTYRQERYYQVQFYAYAPITEELYKRIERSVTDNVFFEVKKYFGESELTFLTEVNWKNLKKFEDYRERILQDFINVFYDRGTQTFFRPDGVYDPYVVEYMRTKVSVKEHQIRPLQLLIPLENYENTIWYKLMEAKNYANLDDLYQYSMIVYRDPRYFRADMNGLAGKNYLVAVESNIGGTLPYPPSPDMDVVGACCTDSGGMGFCHPCHPKLPSHPTVLHAACSASSHHPNRDYGYMSPDTDSNVLGSILEPPRGMLTPNFFEGLVSSDAADLELILFDYFKKNRSINVDKLMVLVENYRKLGKGTYAFYCWALYLELIDSAIFSIT